MSEENKTSPLVEETKLNNEEKVEEEKKEDEKKEDEKKVEKVEIKNNNIKPILEEVIKNINSFQNDSTKCITFIMEKIETIKNKEINKFDLLNEVLSLIIESDQISNDLKSEIKVLIESKLIIKFVESIIKASKGLFALNKKFKFCCF